MFSLGFTDTLLFYFRLNSRAVRQMYTSGQVPRNALAVSSPFDADSVTRSVFRTATLLPAVLHRIDDMLLVKEVNAKFFDHSVDEKLLHAAITSPSAATDFDYERLELLGAVYFHCAPSRAIDFLLHR